MARDNDTDSDDLDSDLDLYEELLKESEECPKARTVTSLSTMVAALKE